MSAFKYWSTSIFFDLLIAGCLYLWKFKGLEGAGNAAMFLIWFCIVCGFIIFFGGKKNQRKDIQRPKGFVYYHFFSEVVLLLFLAWFGHMWTAGFRLASALFAEEVKGNKESPA